MSDGTRNPIIIPDSRPPPRRRGCPKCGAVDYTGLATSGVVEFRCLTKGCGARWQGGIGQEPQDPNVPIPPEDPRFIPIVDFERDPKTGGLREINPRAPDTIQPFRKGLPAPEPGEDDV